MTISSGINGVPNRAFNNAVKAFFRDPIRSIRLIDFLTLKEREILLFTSLGNKAYDRWIDRLTKGNLEWLKEVNEI